MKNLHAFKNVLYKWIKGKNAIYLSKNGRLMLDERQ